MMAEQLSPQHDGILYVSQSSLIALQGDARLLRQQPAQVRSPLSGQYLSPFKGRGMEFEEARPYQPGDDIRSMDWRVTARTSKPHSKVFREERERPVLLWVDFRSPMFFATRHCFKSVLAARAAALLAWRANQLGDRVGGLMFSDQQHMEFRPGRGKPAVLHLLRQLSEFSRKLPAESMPPAMAEASAQSCSRALNRLLHVARPGSLVYLISDFRNLSTEFDSVLSRLARHNELSLLHVYDPLEADLPLYGHYRVTDGVREAEIQAEIVAHRRQYHDRFQGHQQQLMDLCQRSAARYLPLSTEQSLLEGLLQRSMTTKRQKEQAGHAG